MTNKEAIEILKIKKAAFETDAWLQCDVKILKRLQNDIKALDKGIKALENQKTGHWIELGCVGNDNYDFECSECHHTDTQSKTVKVNYCWYCGAKMEGLKGEQE